MKKLLSVFLLLAALLGSVPAQSAFLTNANWYGSGSIPLGDARIVAKGGVVASTTQSSTPTYARNEGRGKITIGREDANNLRLVFCNCYVTTGEDNGANSITVEAALERVSGGSQVVRFTFGGSLTKVLAPGEYVLTDAIPASAFGLSNYAASSAWRWRTNTTVTLGQKWPYNFEGVSATTDYEVLAGELLGVVSNAATSQIDNSGNLTIPSGGASSIQVFGPAAIIGNWVSAEDISVLYQGDSVTYNQADGQDTSLTGGGLAARALREATGGQVPSVTASKSSESAQNWGSGHAFRVYLMGFATHYFDNYGGADGLAGRSAAQIIADKKTIWADFRAVAKTPAYVSNIQIQPGTSSTDSWATLANQTCYAGVSCAGQVRDQGNSGIVAIIGDPDGPDEVYDPNTVWQDAVATTKWVVTGAANYATNDGRHPSTVMHAGAGTAMAANNVDNWSVTGPSAPTNTVPPVASGSPYVGSTLSCTTGTWTGSPSSYAYTWEDAGGTIGGATSSTFVVTNDQLGENVNCSVIATNGTGPSSATDSNAIDIFIPTDIANIVAWYDASQSASITQSGGAVSQWNDLSGVGNNATAASTNQPTTGTRTINSLNALDFDGTSDGMTTNWGNGLVNDSDGATIVFVMATDTPMTAGQYLWSGQQGGGLISGGGTGYLSPNYKAQAASGNGLAEVTITSSTTQHMMGYRRGSGGAGTTQCFYDGSVNSGTTSSNFTTTSWTIGKNGFNNNLFFNGMIAEIFVYSRALTNGEMNQLGGYSGSKWAVTWTPM